MPCYCPLTGYFGAELSASGKRPLVFTRGAAFSGVPVRVPCGQCIGCRLERARQWAMRCLHEKRMSRDSVFCTLTYDDKSLPPYGSLDRRHAQLFMKRLRKRHGKGIRFFGCGEYGGVSLRPHYHLLLYNVLFSDQRFYKYAKDGSPLYYSRSLEEIWPYGFNVLGAVNFDTACYVAKYVCDKVNGVRADAHYSRVTAYGEVVKVQPEFSMMSLKPGIGQGWFDKYGAETYIHDSVIVNEKEVRPPRFYDVKYEGIDKLRMDVLKRKRRAKAALGRSEQTPERRRVREQVVLRNLARNKRDGA